MDAPFYLESNDVRGQLKNDQMFNGMGANGANKSPHLHWHNPPKGTKSFVVVCHDPDAPTPSGFWHWCVFNIPSDITSLKTGISNQMQTGIIETLNDYGLEGFGGACPPRGHGFHAYHFTVYALSIHHLELDKHTAPSKVCFMLLGSLLGKATITGYAQL